MIWNSRRNSYRRNRFNSRRFDIGGWLLGALVGAFTLLLYPLLILRQSRLAVTAFAVGVLLCLVGIPIVSVVYAAITDRNILLALSYGLIGGITTAGLVLYLLTLPVLILRLIRLRSFWGALGLFAV